jgi:glutamate-1-semialdehyde 2,1-aminomutase
MLDGGVWLPPSQFEAAFLSTAHGEAEVRATIEAAREAFHAMGRRIAVSVEIEAC